jgi:hypothetical protein
MIGSREGSRLANLRLDKTRQYLFAHGMNLIPWGNKNYTKLQDHLLTAKRTTIDYTILSCPILFIEITKSKIFYRDFGKLLNIIHRFFVSTIFCFLLE